MTLHRLVLPRLYCVIIDGTLDNEADTQRVDGNDQSADLAGEIRDIISPQLYPDLAAGADAADHTAAAQDELMGLELTREHWSFVHATLRSWAPYKQAPEHIEVTRDLLARIEAQMPHLA
ncbi:hypothetical protein NUM3379_34770 [Kineococcus sp. NUM-3379]